MRALAAGVDCLLVCHTPELQHGAIDALVAAVQSGALARERLEEAAGRVARLQRFAHAPAAIDPGAAAAACGTAEHRALALRMAGDKGLLAAGRDPTEWRKA